MRFDGQDLLELSGARLKAARRELQMIFQDPYSSLNPRRTVGSIVAEPFAIHGLHRDRAERRGAVGELLDTVGLSPEHYNRYPHEFSGGQRQRIGVARALALKPKLLIADEPVSALDVSIQAQVLNLLSELQDRFGLTIVLISHDLSVVRHMCDRVAVMQLGKIVELAPNEALYSSPEHPYTRELLAAGSRHARRHARVTRVPASETRGPPTRSEAPDRPRSSRFRVAAPGTSRCLHAISDEVARSGTISHDSARSPPRRRSCSSS